MATKTSPHATHRLPLNRERILHAALGYIDRHGLEALSMHKLGAELGVEGMSLYNHIANKADLLDGVVETLWGSIEAESAPEGDWREDYRRFARAIRDVLARHPRAAAMVAVRPIMPEAALRAIKGNVTRAVEAGVDRDEAYALLRTVTVYALGHASVNSNWEVACSSCAPSVADLLRSGTPAELAEVAEIFCGRADPDAQFELGLDRMLHGC